MKLATLCYVRRHNRTLMLHRIKKENDMHAGKWNGLGGKLEPGESPEECAVREVREESGLNVHDPHLRGIITFPKFDGIDDWYTFLFTFSEYTGELIESPEGVLRWVDNDELLSLELWPGDRIFIPWLCQDEFFSAKFVYSAGELTGYEATFYGPDGEKFRRVEEAPERSRPERQDRLSGCGDRDERAGPPDFEPFYTAKDDTYCWLCNGPVIKRHCKIVCRRCGFTRDCSDP